MNNQLVSRMNTVGKVVKIITLVVIVFSIIASVAVAAGAVVVTALPKDTVSVNVNAQTDVVLSKKLFESVADDIVEGVNNHEGALVNDDKAFVDVKAENDGGDAVLHVNAERLRWESGSIAPLLWIVFFNLVAFIVCAFFFMNLMGELAVSPSPFTEGVVKKMQYFAIAILSASVATSIANAFIGAILTSGHGFSFSLRFGSIITALIIFVLATVFRYGAQLQKESDETL